MRNAIVCYMTSSLVAMVLQVRWLINCLYCIYFIHDIFHWFQVLGLYRSKREKTINIHKNFLHFDNSSHWGYMVLTSKTLDGYIAQFYLVLVIESYRTGKIIFYKGSGWKVQKWSDFFKIGIDPVHCVWIISQLKRSFPYSL